MHSMLLRSTTKLASSRIFRLTHHPLPQIRTMARLNTKFRLNTGVEIRETAQIATRTLLY